METDLGQLEKALAKRRISEACQMLEGIGNRPFLDQMDLGGPFSDWQTNHRAQAERRLQVAVDHALAALDQSGNTPDREKLAEAWRASGRRLELPKKGRHCHYPEDSSIVPHSET